MRLSELESFPSSFRGWVPGMEAHDVELFHDWNLRRGVPFERIWFNVRLSQVVPSDHGLQGEWAELYADLRARRIDAVGIGAAGVELIEVTQFLSATIYGRVAVYVSQWSHQFPGDPIARVTIVCRGADPTVEGLARSQGWYVERVTWE